MDEAERLRRDRARYRLHCATLIGGVAGLVATFGLAPLIQPWAGPWLLVGWSGLLVLSGVLAVSLGRTMLSPPADPELPGPDPYDDPGDAAMSPGLWSLDLWPSFGRAQAPAVILLLGLGVFGLSLWMAVT